MLSLLRIDKAIYIEQKELVVQWKATGIELGRITLGDVLWRGKLIDIDLDVTTHALPSGPLPTHALNFVVESINREEYQDDEIA